MSEVHLSSRPEADETAAIMAEHQQLKEVLARLEGARDVAALADLLDQLRDLLEVHFEREERADGILRDIGAKAPHRLNALAAVLAEHDVLRFAVTRLADDVRACLDGPVATLLARVFQLRNELHAHEARETEIFLDAMYTDLGTGD